MGVNSYNGGSQSRAYILRFEYNGTDLNVADWKISAKVVRLISSEGIIFPADKLLLQPAATSGSMNPLPTISTIGMPLLTSLSFGNEVFLIPKSNAPLSFTSQWNNYCSLNIEFNLVVAAGAYLKDYQGDNNQKRYSLDIIFTAYGSNNEVIGSFTSESFNIDIFRLSGTPPVENNLSISISGEAVNGQLDFATPSDYQNGVSKTYSNAVIVKSTENYRISVSSNSPTFSSTGGHSLGVGNVHAELTPAANNSASGGTAGLSTIPQTIATGNSTNNEEAKFHLRYYTEKGNDEFIKAKPDTYKTSLVYEIAPQ